MATSHPPVTFARRVFLVAAIYGVVVLLPQYFMESKIGRDSPPPITHPEYFYGFIGVALAWQVVFFLISRDPLRFRPLMLVGVLEKLGFGAAAVVLYLIGRLNFQMLGAGVLDLILGTLFLIAYLRTASAVSEGAGWSNPETRTT